MRCLTLHQPRASLIAVGVKTIETRSWTTLYRGRLVIHSGLRVAPAREWPQVNALPPDIARARSVASSGVRRLAGDGCRLPLIAVVATANLVDCVPIIPRYEGEDPPERFVAVDRASLLLVDTDATPVWTDIEDQRPFGDLRPGRWAWLLDDIKPTTERCPWCLRDRGDPEDEGWRHFGALEPGSRAACPVRDGAGHCDPIPASGRQGLWTWDPSAVTHA